MKNIVIIISLVMTCLFAGPTAKSEIYISRDSISIGGESTTPQWVNIEKFNRLYWGSDHRNFFKIDLSTAGMTYLSGSNNCINFYDNDSGEYGSIFVAGTNIMSDSCAKADIRPLEGDILGNIRPVSFKWADPAVNKLRAAVSQDSDTDTTHYGFLAQELAEILPEAVREDDYGNYLVNYNALIPVLIKALQELDERIDAQAEQLDDLMIEAGLYIEKP